MAKLLNCPICKLPVQILDSRKYGTPSVWSDRYFVRCGCLNTCMSGENVPDLEASWRKWVKAVKGGGK